MNKVRLKVYTNTDDAFLIWGVDEAIGDCYGFCVERRWIKSAVAGNKLNEVEELLNRVGFAQSEDTGPGQRQPSSIWPFQRFTWTDHAISFGDEAQYRVVPMCGEAWDKLHKNEVLASDWVEAKAMHPIMGKLAFFQNRANSVSQWMARVAHERKFKNAAEMVAVVSDLAEDDLRNRLGGPVYAALRNLLEQVRGDASLEIYAALYELTDKAIIDALASIGPRAHVILANGSWKEDRPDENEDAARALKHAVDLSRRMMTTNIQIHNKFIVVTRSGDDGAPVAKQVWTGSTNLTPTGLFTQSNNAVFIESDELAAQYLAQWHRLRKAKNALPSTLAADNPAPGKLVTDPASTSAWFTATKASKDLDALRKLVEDAKDGVLFLTFMPGDSGPVLDVMRARRSGVYVRGVVNQYTGEKLRVELKGGSDADPMELDVVNPDGLREQMTYWAEEYTRGGKLSVLVHSKVLCIDPFGDHPTVVTGSHNFSSAASEKNDDNFVVVRDQPELARAIATYIMGVYQSYRFIQYVAKKNEARETPWNKLDTKPGWLQQRLTNPAEAQERKFWGV